MESVEFYGSLTVLSIGDGFQHFMCFLVMLPLMLPVEKSKMALFKMPFPP